jgi:hypothetical protein
LGDARELGDHQSKVRVGFLMVTRSGPSASQPSASRTIFALRCR